MQSTPDAVTVLVIDDEKGIRDGSKRIIDRMGCRTLTADNGEAGLEIINRNDISIVLLDLKMPGIDGMEVLRRIQEMGRDILVIVITGFATIETAIEAMKRGAYDFIPKPFEPDQLRIVVNRAWEKISLKKAAVKLEQERRRTLADLGTERTRIHTIIDSLPNGIVVTNADGKVVLMNPTFTRLLGLPAETEPERIFRDISMTKACAGSLSRSPAAGTSILTTSRPTNSPLATIVFLWPAADPSLASARDAWARW